MSAHETLSAQAEEAPKKVSWLQKTLKFAGLGYLLGDGAMFFAGRARDAVAKVGEKKNTGQQIGAISWAVGGLAAFIFGNPSQEKQIELRADDLQNFFNEQQAEISKETRDTSMLLRKPGLFGKLERFLYRHPSETLNTAYAVGAVTTLLDGIKEHKDGKYLLPKSLGKSMFTNVATSLWVGALVLIGAVGGMLIKEDPDAQEKAKNGNVFDKVKAWFTEKPLRFSAIAYGLNNVPLAAKAWNDYYERDKLYAGKSVGQPFIYSTVQLGAYLMSNTMLALSGREQLSGEGFSGADMARLEDAAAQVIAAQKPEHQSQLLKETSAFMAKQKGVKHDQNTIATNLIKRVAKLGEKHLPTAQLESQWTARERVRAEAPPALHAV